MLVMVLITVMLSRWLLAQRTATTAREHVAAVARAAREPGTLIVDPALPAGVVEIDLIPGATDLELSRPATIRIGEQALPWEAGHGARFAGLAGKRELRVSVAGAYLVEDASLDVPAGGRGRRVSLRAIPIDPPAIGAPFERDLEVGPASPEAFFVWWKQLGIVVAEVRVPRDALAAAIGKEWQTVGRYKDPAEPKRDRAVVRFEPTSPFPVVLAMVEAIVATKRTMLRGGERLTVPAFEVSVQPPLPAGSPPSKGGR